MQEWTAAGECGNEVSVTFSPDGKHVMSGSQWGVKFLTLWNAETGAEVRTSPPRNGWDAENEVALQACWRGSLADLHAADHTMGYAGIFGPNRAAFPLPYP